MYTRSALGRTGEDLAVDLLRRLGLKILDRNWRCAAGELDLVAAAGDLLVFCEVKTRKTNKWGEPSEAVDWNKQARLRRLVAAWMREHRPGHVQVRFDVVSVIVRDSQTEVVHLPDAF